MSRQKKWKKIRRERRMALEQMGVVPKAQPSAKVRQQIHARKRSIWRRLLDWLRGRR